MLLLRTLCRKKCRETATGDVVLYRFGYDAITLEEKIDAGSAERSMKARSWGQTDRALVADLAKAVRRWCRLVDVARR